MRQFVLENQSVKNGLIFLDGKDYRYLRQVLRAKIGDMINVRMPDGTLQGTTVAKIDEKSKKITLQICSSGKSITRGVQADEMEDAAGGQNSVEYWLFQFIPKPQKFEQIVRQATECGISVIVPVCGEYSEKNSITSLGGNTDSSSGNAKRERIERIVREARQQSGSPINTKILEPLSLEKAVEEWQNGSTKKSAAFVLSERKDLCAAFDESLDEICSDGKKLERVGIVVGSEGGISPAEMEFLVKKALYKGVHFDVNILRCETAAIYGIAAIQTAVMQKNQKL